MCTAEIRKNALFVVVHRSHDFCCCIMVALFVFVEFFCLTRKKNQLLYSVWNNFRVIFTFADRFLRKKPEFEKNIIMLKSTAIDVEKENNNPSQNNGCFELLSDRSGEMIDQT